MTFEEIERQLPNGFHDLTIRAINVDFIGLWITLAMDLHVGLEGEVDPERYRPGTLRVLRPYLFFLQPPDPTYPFVPEGIAVNASGFAVSSDEETIGALIKRGPSGGTTFGFFLNDWNSYLYIGGQGAEFWWDDETDCAAR